MSDIPPAAIVGPTASGKTAVSLELARRLPIEIISVDSRQVYRGMDIGTAKATPEERALVPHHGLDVVEPGARFSAGRFARHSRRWIAEIRGRGRLPLLVGGTGFFLRALTHPIFREPPLDAHRRAALATYLARLSTAELRRWLGALDPVTAERLSGGGGRQRLLRGLELPLLTGRPLSWWHQNAPPEAEPLRPVVFLLRVPRDLLDRQIDARVGQMLADGLPDEVRALHQRGYDERTPGMSATGYAELLPFLRGEVPLDEALARVRANTRAYARRQETWFRRQLPPGAIELDATQPTEELAATIVARWSSATEEANDGDPADLATRSCSPPKGT